MDAHLIGYLAGTLTTICFIPQAWKIICENKAEGISIPMYLIFSTGVACWLAYGVIINNLPIIVFNSATFILTLVIICKLYKLKK